jgi:predicted DNA-binding transcriptional regulator AlpA
MTSPRAQTSWVPRGLRAPQAAQYIGVSQSKFYELVKDGRIPAPSPIDGVVVWDRFELDEAFDALKSAASEQRDSTWDDVDAA